MTQILFQSSTEIPDRDILGSVLGVSRQVGSVHSPRTSMSWAFGLDGSPVQTRNLPGSAGSRQLQLKIFGQFVSILIRVEPRLN